jgi:hypothetical protein
MENDVHRLAAKIQLKNATGQAIFQSDSVMQDAGTGARP